jgi:P27 family predicted phage terminase small subunit
MRKIPNEVKRAQGTYRKDRDKTINISSLPAPDLTPPKYLNKVARQEWNRVAPLLLEQNTLLAIDRSLLASYCQFFSHWIASEADLARNGLVINVSSQTRTGSTVKPVQNPALRNSVAAHRQMLQVSSKFGISPIDRDKVNVSPDAGTEDELDKFLNGGDEDDE